MQLILFLQMPGFNEEGIAWFQSWVNKYPKAMTVWMGPYMPKLVVYHPDTCKLILKSTEPKDASGVGGYEFLRPWLGKMDVAIKNVTQRR